MAPSSVPSAPAVRPPAPQPVTVRPSAPSSITTVSAPPQPQSNIMTQRVLLSPDMQARLPCKLIASHLFHFIVYRHETIVAHSSIIFIYLPRVQLAKL